MSSDIKIKVRGLCKAFGRKVVLRDLDLDVPKGQSLVVIGGSGTGKSVLIKCIIGLMKPDKGSIEIDGHEVTRMSAGEREEIMHKFGMLFQGGALFDSLPVWENVAFGLMKPDKGSIEIDGHEVTRMSAGEREEIMHKFGMLFQGGALFDSLPVWENVAFGLIAGRGFNRAEAKEIALRKLGAVGLGPDVANLFPSELSGGMQKRVSLARAIAIEPEIIFFDEPTTGLDPIMSQVINELIKQCVDDLGATALSITHDMQSLRVIGDNAAMIYDGRIIWHGPAGDIDHSGNAHVEQFVQGKAEGPIKMPVRPL